MNWWLVNLIPLPVGTLIPDDARFLDFGGGNSRLIWKENDACQIESGSILNLPPPPPPSNSGKSFPSKIAIFVVDSSL